MAVKIRLTDRQYSCLKEHLFPSDGLEAVALALCGRRNGTDHTLSMHSLHPVPYDTCIARSPGRVHWNTDQLEDLLNEATEKNLALVKIHSHPGNYDRFSELDDVSDLKVFNTAFAWIDDNAPHASLVMLSDGRIFGRSISADSSFEQLKSIAVVGDDIVFHFPDVTSDSIAFTHRHAQMFGARTTGILRKLTVAVVGCSGTGGPVIEQLTRLGIGNLILVDPDKIEEKNLNRIPNATISDVGQHKVHVLAKAVHKMGLGTIAHPFPYSLAATECVKAVADADIIFGCMDGAEGRHTLNRLACFYSIPYFDLGVKLEADGNSGIDEAYGAVHYIQPDGSSLFSRGVYTLEQVRSEALRRTDPKSYELERKAKYIVNLEVDSPAVASVNTQIAAMSVNEMLARIHPYRLDGNSEFAEIGYSFMQAEFYAEPDGLPCTLFSPKTGRGDMNPLLGMPGINSTHANVT